MPGDRDEDDDYWFKPVWEVEEDIEPPGVPRLRKPAVEPRYDHPLLVPLARAHDAVARLEAKAETASDAVVEGLRLRMAYLEAAGWLRQTYIWIHPNDLALRDNALTGSYAAAAHSDRLRSELPATMTAESEWTAAPSDIVVNHGLRLARLWRRLAELRSWRPLADAGALRDILQSLGDRLPDDAEIEDWLASLHLLRHGPALIRAGRAARDWMNRPGIGATDPAAFLLAACLWRDESSGRRPISLPFWSAPGTHHRRLELHIGVDWITDFLDCVAAAAVVGLREFERLQRVGEKGRMLGTTVRSRLPDALQALIRAPIVTSGSLAASLNVTPQAALGLLRQLEAANLVREVTGRASWRAFVLSAD